jgi:hypothetical protein
VELIEDVEMSCTLTSRHECMLIFQ